MTARTNWIVCYLVLLIVHIFVTNVRCQETIAFDELHHAKCGCAFKNCLDDKYAEELPLDDMMEIIQGLDRIKNSCEPDMPMRTSAEYDEGMSLRLKRLEKVANDLEKTVKQIIQQQTSQVEYLSSLEMKLNLVQSQHETISTVTNTNQLRVGQLTNSTQESAHRMDVLAYHEAMIQNKLKQVESDIKLQQEMAEDHQAQLQQLDSGLHVRMEELNNRVQMASTRHTALQQEVEQVKERDIYQLVSNVQELTAMVENLLSKQEMQAKIQAKRHAFHHKQMLKMADDTCSAFPITLPPKVMHATSEILTTVFDERPREYTEFVCDSGYMIEGGQKFMYCMNNHWMGDIPMCSKK